MARASLSKAVRDSVERMHWLSDTDGAAVELALRYARDLDSGEADVRMTGPKLLEVLRDLGGTPSARRDLGVETQVKGRLAELRAARERRNAS